MSNWISVKDQLPDYETLVLVYYVTKKGDKKFGIAFRCYSEWTMKEQWILGTKIGLELSNVLYWLRIPELPK